MALLLKPLCSGLRRMVSGDKQRFDDGHFNLDLTYITDRIIGVSRPTSHSPTTPAHHCHHHYRCHHNHMDSNGVSERRRGGDVPEPD